MPVFTSESAKEAGRKGGLANGRKKFLERDKIIEKILKTRFNPTGRLADVLYEAGVKATDKISIYYGIFAVQAVAALHGSLASANFILENYGLTPNARERLAKVAALEKMAEKPEAFTLQEMTEITPQQLRSEAEKMGVYEDGPSGA